MGLYSRSSPLTAPLPREVLSPSAKPMLRWWWLSGPFVEADIVRQLEWVRGQGFGGIEIAWLTPRWLDEDDSDRQRPLWLGPRWRDLVAFSKSTAIQLGLRCDFTFGSVWPFGGSWLATEHTSQTFLGFSNQRIGATWEGTAAGGAVPVLNHLSSRALQSYAEPLLEALAPALAGTPSALFCDSLEIETGELWSPELWSEFQSRFGYDLRTYAGNLEQHLNVRYDYRQFIAAVILREFYEAFTAICHGAGALSRVQCHGAPTDLLAAYAAADIPESEALLFPPAFSRIAASAAAWAGHPIVSAEAFTCLYGFPGRESAADELWQSEDVRDLKLLADALFAQGVNQLVWHGMPYQPAGKAEIQFYASVHVAPDAAFASHLAELNRYLEQTCNILSAGNPYSQIGVYLPWEDALMADRLPHEMRTPGANYVWEMRHAVMPPELTGFANVWISAAFLREAQVVEGRIHSRHLSVEALYIDCEWLDGETLEQIGRLLRAGAVIIWKKRTREPGCNQHSAYEFALDEISRRTLPSIADSAVVPVLSGVGLPPFWSRRVGSELLLFLANPLTQAVAYPMPYRLGAQAAHPVSKAVSIYWGGRQTSALLQFAPYQSIALRVGMDGQIEQIANEWIYPGA